MVNRENVVPENQIALDRIVASIVERCRRGESPRVEEYAERYPHLAERIQAIASVLNELSRCGREAGPPPSDGSAGQDQGGSPRVLGEFRILREVGRGGMGIVYEAEQVPLGRRVALKALPFHSLLDARRLERFRREVRAVARLHHTNIVPVYGMGEHDGVHYYAMQFIDGKGLDVVIRELAGRSACAFWPSGCPELASPSDAGLLAQTAAETHDYPPGLADCPTVEVAPAVPSDEPEVSEKSAEIHDHDKENLSRLLAPSCGPGRGRDSQAGLTRSIARIGLQVAEALSHAHGEGILHRDVKPSNLMLDSRGAVWLTDFGLVKDEGSENLTHTGDIIGTLAYMAPERFGGHSDARSDIYSLGVTLYELLTLEPAFRETDRAKVIREVMEVEPTPPRKLHSRIPRDLETIVLKAMAKQPSDRYQTAEEMAEDLRRFLDRRPIRARRIGLPERAWRWCRRKPALASLIVVLLTTAPVVTALVWGYRHADEARLRAEIAAQAERRLSLAQRLHAEGRYGDALAVVEEVLELTPRECGTRLFRSRLLLELDRIDAAREDLEALVREQPSMGETHYLLARIYNGRDDEKARKHEQAAESLLADTAEAYHLRSLAATNWEESIRLLSAGLERDPGNFTCLRSRAYALYAAGDFAGAERDSYVAIGLRPLDAPSWSLRALARRKLGRLEEALSDHNRVIDLSPNDPEAYNHRRETYHLLGDHERALEDARTCIRMDPEPLLYQLNYLKALIHLEEFAEAQREYEALAAARPEFRKTIHRWLQKQVSHRFAAGDSLNGLPEASEGEPFGAMQAARRLCSSLAAKGTRAVGLGSRLTWSPDGKRVAYARGNRTTGVLYENVVPSSHSVVQRSGGIEIRDLESGARRLVVPSGKDPAWSPDGRYIAYVREPIFNDYSQEELWLVSSRGGGERRIALGGYPSWSRDPRRVYFHSRVKEALCVVDIESSDAEPREILPSRGWYPAISPDEKLFAYALGNTLRVVDIGCGRTIHTWTAPVAQNGMLVSWSPDGREISVGGFDDSTLGLWILDVDSLVARKVFSGPVTLGVWSPDRRRFAFDVRGALYETWVAELEDPVSTSLSLGYSEELLALPAAPEKDLPGRGDARLRHMRLLRKLEEGMWRQPDNPFIRERLNAYRRALLPDLATYASVDAALREMEWQVVIPEGATWRFFRGRTEPADGLDWAGADFDDGEWEEGPSGFGYGDGDDATPLEDMRDSYTSVYIRQFFELPAGGDLPEIWLIVRADDGFVAFVNGSEVARVAAGQRGERLYFDSVATARAKEPLQPVWLEVDRRALRPGRNVIALHGLNESLSSSDFSLAPELRRRVTESTLDADFARFEDFRRAAAGPDAPARVAYLEGRLLARHGRHGEAVSRFLEAEALAPGVELLTALAESARECGRVAEVEGRLRAFTERERAETVGYKDLANLWVSLRMVELKQSPEAILRDLPPAAFEGDEPRAPLLDLRWLLGKVSKGEPVRINCGGEEYLGTGGVLWSQDRFYFGGRRYVGGEAGGAVGPFTEDISGTTDDGLYQTERWFGPAASGLPGYRLPLPPGGYRVRLHFAEIYYSTPGRRVFLVRVDGKEHPQPIEPLASGFATAQVVSLDVQLADGLLDIEFVHRAGDPKISAIEIERIKRIE